MSHISAGGDGASPATAGQTPAVPVAAPAPPRDGKTASRETPTPTRETPAPSRETPTPSRELLADRAYVELRDRLVTLRIPPGWPIDEDEIGAELGMGRTPVREAIKRLALENLVTVFPRRGTFASEINITDLAFVSDVRTQLEGHAAYRAAQRITPLQKAELEVLLEELGRSRGGDDGTTLMLLDARVHRFIYHCAGNPYLEETLGRYLNLSLRIWHLVIDRLPHLFAHVHEHGELLKAIGAGQAERARDIVADHIETFEQEIRTVL